MGAFLFLGGARRRIRSNGRRASARADARTATCFSLYALFLAGVSARVFEFRIAACACACVRIFGSSRPSRAEIPTRIWLQKRNFSLLPCTSVVRPVLDRLFACASCSWLLRLRIPSSGLGARVRARLGGGDPVFSCQVKAAAFLFSLVCLLACRNWVPFPLLWTLM